MKNKKKIIVAIIVLIITIIIAILAYVFIQDYRIKHAKIEVSLTESLDLEFATTKRVSDFITSINGKIIDDYEIDSTSLGEKEINFDFINDDNIKVSYSYKVNVVDTKAPLIWLNNTYTIYAGNDINLVKKVLCGDNEDSNPICTIEGKYDYKTVGSYPLTFKATDRSGNTTSKKFTLNVINNQSNGGSSNSTPSTTPVYTKFSDAIAKYKEENTKIGLDISSWQDDVDFKALKNAGVEFVIIRVGGTRGNGGEFFVDKKFVQNITKANEENIDVGIYFYSYANTIEQAKKEAEWVVEQIKDYKVDLPIAYDWENWQTYNEYNLSFFGLTSMASVFLDTVSKYGYDGLLYSSKTYLENIWMPTKYDTWLAHYTNKTNYTGSYKYWQLCNNGKVDGIAGPVDIDVMYLN